MSVQCRCSVAVSAAKVAAAKGVLKSKKAPIAKLYNRDEMAAKYRDKMAWTKHAFKAIGEDAAAAEDNAELVVLSPDGRPDTINGTAAELGMADIPTEAIVGVSVAFALLIFIVLVFSVFFVALNTGNSPTDRVPAAAVQKSSNKKRMLNL